MATATAPPAMVERLPRSRSSRPWSWERVTPILMIAPSVVLVAIFVYYFIARTAYTSLTRWRGVVPDYTFVGFRNYARLFQTEKFQADIVNTIHFTAFFLIGCLVLGLGAAVLLDQKLPGSIIFQNVFMFPLALSFVVTGTVWRWIFNPNYGLNVLFQNAHLGFLKSGWLTDPHTALNSLTIAAVWQMSGFCMAMFLAGLRGIPDELREAARVDGASEFQAFWRVVFPLLRPITLSAVIILGHISLKIFDLVFVMTFGGPGYSTDMPGLNMFITTFRQDLVAQGAAIATVLLLMVALLIVPYLIWNLRGETER
ncbi:MAG TPA: sugar ABC transporter permease [Candidatus Eisenbacteria bacterium]|jgi:glucose/mannose transport system permease protein|nr:sugar ABC transporter permease [Candidatus Eisenbacteria bacterium]